MNITFQDVLALKLTGEEVRVLMHQQLTDLEAILKEDAEQITATSLKSGPEGGKASIRIANAGVAAHLLFVFVRNILESQDPLVFAWTTGMDKEEATKITLTLYRFVEWFSKVNKRREAAQVPGTAPSYEELLTYNEQLLALFQD